MIPPPWHLRTALHPPLSILASAPRPFTSSVHLPSPLAAWTSRCWSLSSIFFTRFPQTAPCSSPAQTGSIANLSGHEKCFSFCFPSATLHNNFILYIHRSGPRPSFRRHVREPTNRQPSPSPHPGALRYSSIHKSRATLVPRTQTSVRESAIHVSCWNVPSSLGIVPAAANTCSPHSAPA